MPLQATKVCMTNGQWQRKGISEPSPNSSKKFTFINTFGKEINDTTLIKSKAIEAFQLCQEIHPFK